MKLALAAGTVDVDGMLESITSPQFTEWLALARVEPFGEDAAWLRHGIRCAAIVNHSMSPPKSAAQPVEFMRDIDKPEKQEMEAEDFARHYFPGWGVG